MNNSYLINTFQYKSAKQIGLMCLLTRDVKSIKVKSLSVLIHYACSRAQRFKALCHRRIHYGDIYSVYKIIFTSGRAAYVGFKNDFYSPIRHDRIRANHPWRSTKKSMRVIGAVETAQSTNKLSLVVLAWEKTIRIHSLCTGNCHDIFYCSICYGCLNLQVAFC